MEVALYHVPSDSRFGPWQRRRWELWALNGVNQVEVVTVAEILCKVNLAHGALDLDSLEALASLGVPTSVQPRRNHTLPPRRG